MSYVKRYNKGLPFFWFENADNGGELMLAADVDKHIEKLIAEHEADIEELKTGYSCEISGLQVKLDNQAQIIANLKRENKSLLKQHFNDLKKRGILWKHLNRQECNHWRRFYTEERNHWRRFYALVFSGLLNLAAIVELFTIYAG